MGLFSNSLVITFIVIIFFIFIDTYAYQSIKLVTSSRYIVLSKVIFFSVNILVYGVFFSYFFYMRKTNIDRHSMISILPFVLFLAILIAKIANILPLLLEDIYRCINAIINSVSGVTPYFSSRSLVFSVSGILLGFFMFGAVIYGAVYGKYNYKVHKKVLYFSDLPSAFDGFKIVQISDIHSGSLTDFKEVQRGIDLINEQNADLFVFTGDIVNNSASELIPWIPYFKKIRAFYGQYSILGNHDYGDYINWESNKAKKDNLDSLKKYHSDLGYRLLLDESVKIEKEGQHIVLLGVENWGKRFKEVGDIDKALYGVDSPDFKILLSHDPTHWDYKVKDRDEKIHLTLSGHTHGVQFGLETPWFKWSPAQWVYKKWAGLYEHNERYLYINRGFGFVGFSGRVGIWPEITLIELKKKK